MEVRDLLKKIRPRWVILAGLLFLIGMVRTQPAWGEAYARHVYPMIAHVLSRFSALFPFTIGDLFIYGSIAGLVVYLLAALIRRKNRWRAVRHVVEYLAWVYVWFYMVWGLNYFRENFYVRTQIPYQKYEEERFQAFLQDYTEKLNAAWVPVDRIDKELVRQEVLKGYRELPERFGLMQPHAYLHPKTMLWSRLMSGVGVLGYIGPFFIEYHLNGDLLPVQYPMTYAHEMAHVLSVSSEAEANLFGYLICTGSEVPEIRFSGYFSLFPYVLGNAHRVLKKEDFVAWRKLIRPEIVSMYNEKVTYWRSLYNPLIGDAQEVMYDLFLKGNKVSAGTANYSQVIGLLIALDTNP